MTARTPRDADRVVERVVQAGGVRPGAAAEPDHAVVLAAVVGRRVGRQSARRNWRIDSCSYPAARSVSRPCRYSARRCAVPLRIRPGRRPPAQPGQRPHVQRVEVELLGPPAAAPPQRQRPGRRGLPGDAVDQVEVEHGDAGASRMRGQRAVHLGASLRPAGGVGLRVEEALHADADPARAVRREHGQPVRRRGGRRRLDRQRDRRPRPTERPAGRTATRARRRSGRSACRRRSRPARTSRRPSAARDRRRPRAAAGAGRPAPARPAGGTG